MSVIISSNLVDPQTKAPGTLIGVTVMFVLPDGDDRDHDTRTSFQLKRQNGTAIAGDPDVAPGQHMADPGTYGPYKIPVQDQTVTQADYKGAFCEVTIQPVGHDHWIFNAVILATFSDGTMIHSQSGFIGLDQDQNAIRFGL